MEDQRNNELLRKMISGTVPMLLLISIAILAFSIQPVKASGTIYIRADGSIDPPSAPIERDGDVYTLIGNITSDADGIVIERNNITLDGAGYTVQGTEAWPFKGIYLSGITNVTIHDTSIKNFFNGIYLDSSSNSTIFGNDITNNSATGIYLQHSSNNSISRNNITANNGSGMYLFGCFNNTLSGNKVANNYDDILLSESSNNSIAGNTVLANRADGINLEYSSNSNSIFENNVSNSRFGILLEYSCNYSIVSGNNATANNWYGIGLYGSSNNNTISENSMTANKEAGIAISESSNNTIYHNNFVNNAEQAHISPGYENFWDDDYPSGGNYWSDYPGIDLYGEPYQNLTGSDGIGDTSYTGWNLEDNYPLMAPINIFDAGTWDKIEYYVDVVSNSTISDFCFNPDEGAFLRFNVTGEDDTSGFCRVTIPIDLLWVEDGWTITVGDQAITDYKIIPDGNCTYLYFSYSHSTQTVIIQGTHVIPEFPFTPILILLMPTTLIATTLWKTKRKRQPPKFFLS
jgi:parallel beta-helix repeat protein